MKIQMKTNNLQYRSLDAEFTADEDSRTIHGLAIPVNSRSAFIHDNLGEYYEVILPSAVNEDLILNNDVKIYLDHDAQQGTYARSKYGKGSLRLEVTERGLEFEFEAPKSVFGDALLEGIKRGDYDKISFAFWAKDKEDANWTRDENGEDLHVISHIRWLEEISILSLQPAFSATDVELRSLQEYRDEQEEKYNKALRLIDEASNDLNNLYNKYIDITY